MLFLKKFKIITIIFLSIIFLFFVSVGQIFAVSPINLSTNLKIIVKNNEEDCLNALKTCKPETCTIIESCTKTGLTTKQSPNEQFIEHQMYTVLYLSPQINPADVKKTEGYAKLIEYVLSRTTGIVENINLIGIRKLEEIQTPVPQNITNAIYRKDRETNERAMAEAMAEARAEICARNYGIVGYGGIDCGDGKGGLHYFLLMIQNILKWVITIATLLAVIMFLYTGIKLLGAGGDTTKLTEAKKGLTNVIIGLVLIGSAWLIVDWVFEALGIEDYKWTEQESLGNQSYSSYNNSGNNSSLPITWNTPNSSGNSNSGSSLPIVWNTPISSSSNDLFGLVFNSMEDCKNQITLVQQQGGTVVKSCILNADGKTFFLTWKGGSAKLNKDAAKLSSVVQQQGDVKKEENQNSTIIYPTREQCMVAQTKIEEEKKFNVVQSCNPFGTTGEYSLERTN
ncbi:MAG: TrbC/VirB2 family protein [Candidatus Pacebacteria bacterium]|nr:TrbC/VirB2 family protein [Candidatus Paceibacterota bacterium]